MRVGLVGCGRWGSKLLRILVRRPGVTVRAVVDPSPAALARALAVAPSAVPCRRLDDALTLELDAAWIASPSGLHAEHCRQALRAGLDVLVEKPLCTSAADARELRAEAEAGGRIAMVGHVLRFHPAVSRLVALARDGSMGALRHLEARRHTASGSPEPLWTLGPHELSTLHALDPSGVVELDAARGTGADAAVTVRLRLASGLCASLSWSTRARGLARCLVLRGERRLAFLDELDGSGSLRLGEVARHRAEGELLELPEGARVAVVPSRVEVPNADPLARQVDHFARCVAERSPPLTGFDEGLWVVETLARAQAHLDAREQPIMRSAGAH